MSISDQGRESRLVPSGIGLRSHLAILCALLASFAVMSTASFWYGTRSADELEASLEQNREMLAKLPELRGGVRQIELLTELYFKTRETSWLERRREAVANVQARARELESLSTAAPGRGQLASFEAELKVLLDRQGRLIGARRAPERREQDLLKSGRDNLLEIIGSFGDQAALGLQESAFKVQGISYRLYLARLVCEFAIASSVMSYLFFFILRPLRAADKIAVGWKLGEPWPVQTLHSIPEIRSAITHFAQMAQRLNSEFAKAQELSRFKTNLVSVVSHEFGNALAIIQSVAHILKEKSTPEQRRENEEFFAMIFANIEGLVQAVQNLLNMGYLDAGKLAVNFTAVDAAAVMVKTYKRLELLCEKKGLSVSFEFPEGLRPVRADASALSLVVSNLLSNAIKYTPAKGRISLGLLAEETRPGFYRLYVEDSGIGIPEEEREKVLKGHYRAAGGRKMTLKGYGVGLSLAEQIVEAHDSSIRIEGEPGKGSRFSFLLPIDASARAEARLSAGA